MLGLKEYNELNNNSKKKKIGIFIGGKPNYYSASSYIRLLSPLNELSNEFSIYIINNETHKQFLNDLENNKKSINIIIIERDIFDRSNLKETFIKTLFKKLKENNIKIIFDIDDDLLNIDETHPSYEEYSKINNILTFIIKNSNLITVSTNHLKKTLIKLNEKIIVIPNTLLKTWAFNSNNKINNLNSKKIIKIGYFGTRSHGEDIKIIKQSFENAKNKLNNKTIIFEIIGVSYDTYDWATKIDIPNNYKNNPNTKERMKNFIQYFFNKFNLFPSQLQYPNFVNWMKNEIDWDIAVAPLEDSNINRSKSNLKYLEYTAMNIPCIYSDIGPYKDIKDKKTGLIVENKTECWTNAIINLIEDEELYKTILKNAYEDVEENYLVENATSIWKKVLDGF